MIRSEHVLCSPDVSVDVLCDIASYLNSVGISDSVKVQACLGALAGHINYPQAMLDELTVLKAEA